MLLERTDFVLNHQGLTSHGNAALRKAAIDIIEHGLRMANPYLAVKRLLQLKGDVLQVGNLELELDKFKRIFIIGAGKASFGIAQALGRTQVSDAELLCAGHFHHFVMSEGTGRTILQVPAMDGGSKWFTATSGQSSQAGGRYCSGFFTCCQWPNKFHENF
jgi:hypothetical protein